MMRGWVAVLAIVVLASSCGGSEAATTTTAAPQQSSGGTLGESTQGAAGSTVVDEGTDSAFSDPADAAAAQALEARDACLAERLAADPALDALFAAADAAGGSANLAPQEHVAVITNVTECSPAVLVQQAFLDLEETWLTDDEALCLATAVEGSPTRGLAYLGLLHLVSGRLEAPAWATDAEGAAVVPATSCLAPKSPILAETLASVLEDPRSAPAVDTACLDGLFVDPNLEVNYWLQRYRRVVYRLPDDEAIILALEVPPIACMNPGILYQASLWRERGIEISTATAACIGQALVGSDYARAAAFEDPAAATLLSDAAGGCVTEAERAQFGG